MDMAMQRAIDIFTRVSESVSNKYTAYLRLKDLGWCEPTSISNTSAMFLQHPEFPHCIFKMPSTDELEMHNSYMSLATQLDIIKDRQKWPHIPVIYAHSNTVGSLLEFAVPQSFRSHTAKECREILRGVFNNDIGPETQMLLVKYPTMLSTANLILRHFNGVRLRVNPNDIITREDGTPIVLEVAR